MTRWHQRPRVGASPTCSATVQSLGPNRRTSPQRHARPSTRWRRRKARTWYWRKPAPESARTLGYIAPASLWAERNEGTVWLSTYTRNLQRQIDQELDRLYPEPKAKAEKVVLRKGRENYFCLLNMEEAVGRSALVPSERIALGLMARWAASTRDGDMTGGDLPAWLADLLGFGRTLGLADRRGECIHGACTHYRRCFIEKSQRRPAAPTW